MRSAGWGVERSGHGARNGGAHGLVGLAELLADLARDGAVGDQPGDEGLEQLGGEHPARDQRLEHLVEARLAVRRDLALGDDAVEGLAGVLVAEGVGRLEERGDRLVELLPVELRRAAQPGLDLGELPGGGRGLGEEHERGDVGARLAPRTHLVRQVHQQREGELVVAHPLEHLAEEREVDAAAPRELVGDLVGVDRLADDLGDVAVRAEAVGGDLAVHARAALGLLEVGDLGDLPVLAEVVERPLVPPLDHLRQGVVADELLPLGPRHDLLGAVGVDQRHAVHLVDVVQEDVERGEVGVGVGDAGELGAELGGDRGVELAAPHVLERRQHELEVGDEKISFLVVRPVLGHAEGGLDLRAEVGGDGGEGDSEGQRGTVHGNTSMSGILRWGARDGQQPRLSSL